MMTILVQPICSKRCHHGTTAKRPSEKSYI